MEEIIPDILYHYCSVDTFVNIIQKRTLRISEIAKSNDSMECKWLEKSILPKKIKACFEEILISKGLDPKANNDVLAKCLNRYSKYYGDDIDIQTPRLVFALCLSEEGDLLSQWRGYAADGFGISLGFNKEFFRKIHDINRYVHIRKVLYSETDQMDYFDDEIHEYVSEVIANNDIRSYASLISLLASITEHAVIMKNPAFGEEKEWRLFTYFTEIENLNDVAGDFKSKSLNKVMGNMECTVRSNKLIYYHDLLLDLIHQGEQKIDCVSKIILGPKCRLSERDIVFLLEKSNWDMSRIDIVHSKASYV